MSAVYAFVYTNNCGDEKSVIIRADDLFTAIAKWRTYVVNEKIVGDLGPDYEPDCIAQLDGVAVVA